MLKSNLVVTYEVGNRDILVLLIHGVLLSLCSRVDVRRFHFFLFLFVVAFCEFLTNSMSLGSQSVATAAAAFSFCSFMACCWVNSAGWMCVVFVILFSCLLLRLASFRRWIDFRMHNRSWRWSERIFFMLCVISTWFWISTKQELGRRKLQDCTNLNCVEIYVGILEEEESRILIL